MTVFVHSASIPPADLSRRKRSSCRKPWAFDSGFALGRIVRSSAFRRSWKIFGMNRLKRIAKACFLHPPIHSSFLFRLKAGLQTRATENSMVSGWRNLFEPGPLRTSKTVNRHSANLPFLLLANAKRVFPECSGAKRTPFRLLDFLVFRPLDSTHHRPR